MLAFSRHDSLKASEDIPMTPQAERGAPERDHGRDVLPVPVLQSSFAGSRSKRRGEKKSARIDGGRPGVRVHWSRFRQRLGTGTAPSTSTVPEESAGGSSIGDGRRPSYVRRASVRIEGEKDEVDEVSSCAPYGWCGADCP
jgi:osomolarity two-component system, sensor histidine kinase SLN1